MFHLEREPLKRDIRQAIMTDLDRYLREGGKILKHRCCTFEDLMKRHKAYHSRTHEAVKARKEANANNGVIFKPWKVKNELSPGI